MNKEKVYHVIDEQSTKHLEELRKLIRQPSISAENLGIKECAELLRASLEDLGCDTAKIEPTTGLPVVYGEYDAHSPVTILVYMMYDTQPVDEPGWTVPPLEGALVEMPPFGECLVARGAINTKGPLRAFLNACNAIKGAGLELPVNLLFVMEGEEELGSRHLPEFLSKYDRRLKQADAVFFPSADQDQKGKVEMDLGVKGIVYFELELSGREWGKGPTEFGIHGSNKAWVDSPVWRMIQCLGTMTSEDGNRVRIEGFYDNVIPPPPEDLDLLGALEKTFDEKAFKDMNKVHRFVEDCHGKEALMKYLYTPTLNIDGVWAGYTGPGTKTLLPHKITAKMDVRLVPNMTVAEALPKIKRHLDKHGFREVEIRRLEEGYGWAKTSVKEKAVQAVLSAYEEWRYPVEIWPHVAGSAPFCMFNGAPLNLPFVIGGIGHGGRAHAPNEYLVIDEGGPTGGLKTLEKSYVAILFKLREIL